MKAYIICNDNHCQDDIHEYYLNKYKGEICIDMLNKQSCGKIWYLQEVEIPDYEEEQ